MGDMAQTNSLFSSFSGAIALAMACMPALADDYSSVAQLLQAGNLAQAQIQADKLLAAQPKDLRLRFIKGVVLQDSGKTAEAIALFIQLTQDYPRLPEPHNNLAVLYANDGQYEMARVALEAALGTHSSYLIAHENLGDLYARSASQTYHKALQAGNAAQVAAPKLVLIREMVGAAQRPAPMPTKPPKSVVPVVPAASPAVVAQSVPPAAPVASAAKVVGDSQEVQAAVAQWAKAWSQRDVSAYLALYGEDFEPAGAMGRSAWEAERQLRISSKSSISVKVGELSVSVTGTHALAKFRQEYKAGGLAVSSRKKLDFAKVGARWYIVKESVGN